MTYLFLWKHQLYLYSDLSSINSAESRSGSPDPVYYRIYDSYTINEDRGKRETKCLFHSNVKYKLNNR